MNLKTGTIDGSHVECPDGLNEDFWGYFLEHIWEKKPMLLKKPFGADFIGDTAGLKWLRGAFSEEGSMLGKEFFINGRMQPPPSGDLLPRSDETTIKSFCDRLAASGVSDYQYVMYGLGRFDPDTMVKGRQALSGLTDRLGVAAGSFDTDCFFGDYKETAAGLHKDNAAVFSYVVHGEKTMLVWPYEYFAHEAKMPDAVRSKVRLSEVDFRPHLEAATVLTGQAGDFMYWPSTYWHVSVGEGRPQMTFNMSLYFPWRPRNDVDEILNLLTHQELSSVWDTFYPMEGRTLEQMAARIPDSWSRIVECYRKALSSKRFEGMLLAAWLRKVSTGGFTTRPAQNLDWRLAPGQEVQGRSELPVLTAPAGEGKVMVAAAGSVFLSDEAGPAIVVAARSREPGAFLLEDLAAEHAPGNAMWLAEARRIGEKLVKCWGLTKVEKC